MLKLNSFFIPSEGDQIPINPIYLDAPSDNLIIINKNNYHSTQKVILFKTISKIQNLLTHGWRTYGFIQKKNIHIFGLAGLTTMLSYEDTEKFCKVFHLTLSKTLDNFNSKPYIIRNKEAFNLIDLDKNLMLRLTNVCKN